jgi:hypothetical protein
MIIYQPIVATIPPLLYATVLLMTVLKACSIFPSPSQEDMSW